MNFDAEYPGVGTRVLGEGAWWRKKGGKNVCPHGFSKAKRW